MFEKICTGIAVAAMAGLCGAVAYDHIVSVQENKSRIKLREKQIEALEKNINAVEVIEAEIKKETKKSAK